MSENDGLAFASPLNNLFIKYIVHNHKFFNSLLFSDAYILLLQWYWSKSVIKIEESLLQMYSTEHSNILIVR